MSNRVDIQSRNFNATRDSIFDTTTQVEKSQSVVSSLQYTNSRYHSFIRLDQSRVSTEFLSKEPIKTQGKILSIIFQYARPYTTKERAKFTQELQKTFRELVDKEHEFVRTKTKCPKLDPIQPLLSAIMNHPYLTNVKLKSITEDDILNKEWNYLLFFHILNYYPELMIDLINKIPEKIRAFELNKQDPMNGGRLLTIAASKGLVDIIQTLLDNGADANKTGNNDLPLQHALKNNHIDAARILIKHTKDKEWPSYYTGPAIRGHIEAIKFLLESGIDPNILNYAKRTHPLSIALEFKQLAVAETLIPYTERTDFLLGGLYEALRVDKVQSITLIIFKKLRIKGLSSEKIKAELNEQCSPYSRKEHMFPYEQMQLSLTKKYMDKYLITKQQAQLFFELEISTPTMTSDMIILIIEYTKSQK